MENLKDIPITCEADIDGFLPAPSERDVKMHKFNPDLLFDDLHACKVHSVLDSCLNLVLGTASRATNYHP